MGADERRRRILEILAASPEPVTGASLASRLGVTRQVIVQDIALLRARGEPILATPKGYTMWDLPRSAGITRLIAVKHDFDQTRDELLTMVNAGVEVIDVIVEHPVYGQLTGQLSISTPEDVECFMETIETTQSGLLSSLTDGIHLHTVKAANKQQLDRLEKILQQKGFLLSD
ncbi:MAG: transcription repressor NadR [Firmicutes bacterium]|jgi:transcriptional regulator of NAD metabolism|nr:transcription repressor NadR [Candidatus Fermentithermobacillaceae bacterium]